MAKKIKVFIFQNGKYRVYLPYSAGSSDLVVVTVQLIKSFNLDKNLGRLQLKSRGKACHEITVESCGTYGFVLDGQKYEYGEVYTRVN